MNSKISFFLPLFCVLTGCSVEEALEAASLHPAQLLGVSHKKGNLDYGSDAGQDLLHQRSRKNHVCSVWTVAAGQHSLCLLCCAQTSFCSMMPSTSKPPTFLERRFGEKDHRRRSLQMDTDLTAGTLGAFRGRCLPQNHKSVECFNSSEHTENFI